MANKRHYIDCECSECLYGTSKKGFKMKKLAFQLIALSLCSLFYFIGRLHTTMFNNRPMTVNERQTWFRENGYLDVNEPKNFDGKCGELLHNAEKDAMFWNYEKK